MLKSKLFQLLHSLSQAELRKFNDFVYSPYFNKHKQVSQLFTLLIADPIKFSKAQFTKETIGKTLFKNKKWKAQQVSDVMSYLTQLLEEFIACEQYTNQKLLKKHYLLEQYNKRNLQAVFQWTQGEYRQQFKKISLRDEAYYLQGFMFEKEVDAFLIKNENRKSHESIQQKADYLDLYYLTAKLKICCEMLNRQNIVAANYDIKMLDEVLTYLSTHSELVSAYPSINIYYHIFLSLKESETSEHYFKLIKLLQQHHDQFTREEARQMYDFAQNYCIKKINSGTGTFAAELLKLYKHLLSTQLIFEGKYLSQWDYKNITTIALREEAYDWTKHFIVTYKEHLAPEFRDNAYTYNLASYYYAVEKYKEALKLLQTVEFTDVFYHLGAKSLLLKAFYETDNAESFYSLIAAFRVYLRRNKKISEVQITNHFNLINLAKKCFDLKYNDYSKFVFQRKLQNIKSKITASKNIANLAWISEKIKEFEK
jgi:hypothetical protein